MKVFSSEYKGYIISWTVPDGTVFVPRVIEHVYFFKWKLYKSIYTICRYKDKGGVAILGRYYSQDKISAFPSIDWFEVFQTYQEAKTVLDDYVNQYIKLPKQEEPGTAAIIYEETIIR